MLEGLKKKVITSKTFSKALNDVTANGNAIARAINSNFGGSSNTFSLSLESCFSGIAAICLRKRANNISVVKSKAGYMADETFTGLPDTHWMNLILKKPCVQANWTWSNFKKQINYWLDCTGNAYLYTPLIIGKPAQIYLLPATKVKPKINLSGSSMIEYYEWNNKGIVTRINTEEICHFKTIFPNEDIVQNMFIGSPGIFKGIVEELGINKKSLEYINKFMSAQGLPPIVIESPSPISDEQWLMLKTRLDELLGKEHPKLILENNAKLNSISITGEVFRMLYKDSMMREMIQNICMAFEVPLPMLEANFQNKSVAVTTYQNFYDHVIKIIHTDIDDQLTNHFSRWDEKLVVTHIPEKFVDQTEDIAQKTYELNYGISTRNELRAEKGKEPIEGGDEPLIGSGFMPWSSLGLTIAPEPGQTNSEPQKSIATEIENTLYWNKKELSIVPYRDKIQRKVKSTFTELGKEVEKNIKHSKSYEKEGLSSNIDLFNVKQWKDKLGDNVSPEVVRFITDMMDNSAADVDYEFIESDWEKDIKELTKNSTDKIKDSIDTIHDDLKKTIKNIIEENPTATRQELLEKILDKTSGKFSDVYTISRANAIATTTTTFANGAAQDKVWSQLGFKKSWVSQRDGVVRISHRRADGSKPDKNGNFKVGYDIMKHPGGGSLAEENVNCRCMLKAVK